MCTNTDWQTERERSVRTIMCAYVRNSETGARYLSRKKAQNTVAASDAAAAAPKDATTTTRLAPARPLACFTVVISSFLLFLNGRPAAVADAQAPAQAVVVSIGGHRCGVSSTYLRRRCIHIIWSCFNCCDYREKVFSAWHSLIFLFRVLMTNKDDHAFFCRNPFFSICLLLANYWHFLGGLLLQFGFSFPRMPYNKRRLVFRFAFGPTSLTFMHACMSGLTTSRALGCCCYYLCG